MLLTVIHDRNGNILSAVAHPQGTPPSGPQIKPGQYVADIDVPEIAADLEPPAVFERMARVVEGHRVELKAGKALLARKAGTTGA
ncbi:hypothetical protein ACFRAR_16705 [Kitasatospora sp. NPDC056651]|uniref:hypothetical protein n=1 Tax=Kitasatospora sp. NPDC056651 TaxID=3345892 RepID=UPI0036868B16